MVGGTSGAPSRLGIGTDGQVLTVSSGSLTWATPSGTGDVVGGTTSAVGEVATYTSTSGKAIGRSYAIFSGPATTAKTYTLPNQNATIVCESVATGGILLGDSTPDAGGEIGYASNAFTLYGGSEDLSLTAGTNTWTLSSSTGVTDVSMGSLRLLTAASTSSMAGFRLPHGTAPSSPTNGDVWTTTSGLYVQINGSTVGPLGTGGSMTYPSAGIAVSTGSAWGTSLTAPSGAIVGTTDTQTLTNKTFGGNITLQNGELIKNGTNGRIDLAGGGGTNNEDLTIDLESTANTVTFGSTTGVTDISFGALNLATTGTISGRVPVYEKSSTASLTAAECRGTFIMATAAITLTLPAAATVGYGSVVCFFIRDASEKLGVDVQSAEKINNAGTAGGAGKMVSSTGAGNFVSLISTTDADGSGTDGWIVLGTRGTWTTES